MSDSELICPRLAARYRLAATDAFDLLQEVGRDCVGTIQLLMADELARRYDLMSIWPIEGAGPHQYALHEARLVMALLGKHEHYRFMEAQRRDFYSTAALYCLRSDA